MMPGFDKWQEMTYQKALEECQGFIKSVEEQGKIPLIKDHAYQLFPPLFPPATPPPVPAITDPKIDSPSSEGNNSLNPTYLPTRWLLTFTPILIIRHPAYIVPSFVRANSKTRTISLDDPEFAACCAFKSLVKLMEFYRANGIEPIVIDGGRLVNETKHVISTLCEKVGIDESLVKYEWETKNLPPGPAGTLMDAFVGTISRSTGVIRERGGDKVVNLDEQAEKWEDEWDEEIVKGMVKVAKDAMADYEHLLGYAI